MNDIKIEIPGEKKESKEYRIKKPGEERDARGRKCKYRDDMPEKLVEYMSKGLSFEACCGKLGIVKDTGNRWVKDFPEFGAAKALGEVQGQLFWEEQAIEGLWSSKDTKFNATVFIFVMKNRFGWRDRKEISGSLGLGIGLDGLFKNWSDQQIENEIASLTNRLMPKPEGPKRT